MGDTAEKLKEKEGSITINFPSVNTGRDNSNIGSKLKKGLFWGFAILTLGLPVLVLKTWKDFIHVEEEEEEGSS